MKSFRRIFLTLMACLLAVVPVWADTPGKEPDYRTDYYMVVESRQGGIDIYPEASLDGVKLNGELIPNGTALHIEGETEDGTRTWGYVEYHGIHGYVPLDDCKPVTVIEAVKSELGLLEAREVDYEVEASAQSGSLIIYRGPGEKFGQKPGTEEVPNGKRIHITQEIQLEDNSAWGLTEVEGIEGWISLEDTKRWREKEKAPAALTVSPSAPLEEAAATVTPKEEKPSKAPVPTEKAANTPAPTAEVTPAGTPTPTQEPDKSVTEKPKAASADRVTITPAEEQNQEALGQAVERKASWWSSPLVWIGILTGIAVVLLLVYHFKKR